MKKTTTEIKRTAITTDTCPCCSCETGYQYTQDGRAISGIYVCQACGGIHGTCYLGDSYGIVSPYMTNKNVPSEQTKYFDFTTLGSKGIGRRHGWFDPQTRLITQVG